MQPLLAVTQMTSTEHVDKNWQTCARLIEEARVRGASLVSLPENFAFIGPDGERARMAEPLDGPLFRRYRDLAARHKVWVSFGGFQEKGPSAHNFNTHVVVDDQGEIRSVYRKTHLFVLDIPDMVSLDESKLVEPGHEMVLSKTPLGQAGLSICYDIRFGGLYSALADAGAELMLIPAAFTATTGKAHWEILLRARAIETQCYVAAAAQFGAHNAHRRSHGHSMIVDPWGTVVAQCSETEGVAVAPIDLSYLRAIREHMPVREHKKPALYQSPVSLR